MKFLDWYVKIGVVSALCGASMEYFMIKTGFCASYAVTPLRFGDDKVTVLEAEKRAWETTPEAQAIKDALNPWQKHDMETRKDS